MTRVTKVLLVAGVVCLGLGLLVSADVIDSRAHPMLTVVLPMGAICLGLFFISYIFENETARFDAEQQALLQSGRSAEPADTARETAGCGRPAVAEH